MLIWDLTEKQWAWCTPQGAVLAFLRGAGVALVAWALVRWVATPEAALWAVAVVMWLRGAQLNWPHMVAVERDIEVAGSGWARMACCACVAVACVAVGVLYWERLVDWLTF